jgi:hypothetical protein
MPTTSQGKKMISVYVSAILGVLALGITGHAHYTVLSNIKAARAAAAERAVIEQQQETEQQVSLEEAVSLIQRAK